MLTKKISILLPHLTSARYDVDPRIDRAPRHVPHPVRVRRPVGVEDVLVAIPVAVGVRPDPDLIIAASRDQLHDAYALIRCPSDGVRAQRRVEERSRLPRVVGEVRQNRNRPVG